MVADFPPGADLLDHRILNLLIARATHAEHNGYGWYGFNVGQTLRALGMRPTRENVCKVRSAYRILEREGRAYPLHGSRKVKWFPSSREVVRDAVGQTRMGEFV